MIIKGVHTQGMGGANRSVRKQLPLFKKLGLPNAETLFEGTINLDCQPHGYKILSYDHLFTDVIYKRFPFKRQEDFGFIRILRLWHKGIMHEDWGFVYVPHKSPHFGNQSLFELLGKRIENFTPGDPVMIQVADDRVGLLTDQS